MSRLTLVQFVETRCVPRLSATAVYKDVRFAKRGPNFLQGMCPFGVEDTPPGSFVVDARTLRWTCLYHCHRAGQSVLAYVNGGQFPQPGTGRIAACLEKLRELAGIPPEDVPEISPETEHELLVHERVVSLLETFLVLAQRRLEDAKASVRRPLLALLTRNGFDADRIGGLGLGVVGELSEMRRELGEAGYSDQEIDASSLLDDTRLAGRLIGPIRDRFGCILSFWARDPRDRSPKFLFKGTWKDLSPLVGLDAAFAGKSSGSGVENLMVFERLFDALVLQSLGWTECAAIVGPGSDMTPLRWQRLAELGVRRVTLVPDDSEASRSHAWNAAENAYRASVSPDVRVLPPESLRPYSSGVALARARGIAKLQALVQADSVHGLRYKALSILRRHQPASGWTEPCRHAAWKEAIEFYARSSPQHLPLLDAHFVPAIEVGLQRTWATFDPVPGDAEVVDKPLRLAPSAEATDASASHSAENGGPSFHFVEGPHDLADLRPAISRPPTPSGPDQTEKKRAPLGEGSPGNEISCAPIDARSSFAGHGAVCAVHQCDVLECFCFD
jgi:hypothetical protein